MDRWTRFVAMLGVGLAAVMLASSGVMSLNASAAPITRNTLGPSWTPPRPASTSESHWRTMGWGALSFRVPPTCLV